MMASNLAWRVEETCLNAWPGLRQVLLDGWVLRFSEGLTRRANSANPLRGPRESGGGVIAACEALYQRRQLPTIFRLPSIIDSDLDQRLDELGYGREGGCRQVRNVEVSANLGWANPSTASSMVMRRG